MGESTIFEVCIDSVAGAVAAEQGGADRLELCSALSEGGLTPSCGLVQKVVETTNLPVMMMIRPRGGNFVYSESEVSVMLADIDAAKTLKVAGVVFGCLSNDQEVDSRLCEKLLGCCDSLSATFHRAFDEVADPISSLAIVERLGFERVLTSGQAPTAVEGMPVLKSLVASAGDLIVMPGAGVRPENAGTIIAQCGATEIHGTASELDTAQPSLRVTSVATVRAIRQAIP